MIKSLILSAVLSVVATSAVFAQCGSGCGGGYMGGCGGSYMGGYGGGSYYMGGSYMGGGCGSGSCGDGSYYVNSPSYVSARTTMQVVNVPGGERTRGYVTANVFGVRRSIPVINGQLPAISQVGNRLILDYSYEYVYTTAYNNGINYIYGQTVAKTGNNAGPAAVKNYGQEAAPAKKAQSGAAAVQHPDRTTERASENLTTPMRPSDAEIESLLK